MATWVPMGTLFSCWVPIGSPFLFQGPHFLYLGLRDACKFNGDSISSQCLINCDNTNESHACLSVKSVLLQYIPPPPLEASFQLITLFCSILQTFAFWVPILLPRVPISLKIGSPMGPLFDNLGSQWHVATVKTGSLTGSACKNQVLLRSWTNNVSDNFNINVRMLQNNV